MKQHHGTSAISSSKKLNFECNEARIRAIFLHTHLFSLSSHRHDSLALSLLMLLLLLLLLLLEEKTLQTDDMKTLTTKYCIRQITAFYKSV